MKLIFEHHWGGEPCSGTSTTPFEYESKEKFLLDTWNKYDKKYWKYNTCVELFGDYLYKEDIEDLEYNIHSLDEWFEKNKRNG